MDKKQDIEKATLKAKQIVESNAAVVFSKTFCPYCVSAKKLLTDLGAKFKAVELDKEDDGADIQAALAAWTGQRTVPNVFIGGKHIGGNDTTQDLQRQGKLIPLLTEAGAIAKVAA